MARRSLLTADTQAKICQAITLGCTYKLAAQYANISEATLYNWLRQGREGRGRTKVEFFKAVKEAETKHAITSLASIMKASKDGSWQAGAWLLERRHGYTRDGSASRPAPPADPKAIKTPIDELREMREKAMSGGSFVAAAKLLQAEQELTVQQQAADRERAKAERADIPAGALLEELAREFPEATLHGGGPLANSFIVEREQWLGFVSFFRRVADYFLGRYGVDLPFDVGEFDDSRRCAYFFERVATAYFSGRLKWVQI